MTYEELLLEADKINLIVREKYLSDNDGRIKGRRIAIRKDIPSFKEKSCVLAEELGHYHTNCGDILDQEDYRNRKQEYKARLYGYNMKVGLDGLINAFKSGCQNLNETAEYLDVTETYLVDALQCYRNKYGVYTVVSNYIIYFQPTLVIGKVIID